MGSTGPSAGCTRPASWVPSAWSADPDDRVSSFVEVSDPADPRLDDFRDLTHADRRPDRPGGGLVVAEGVVVVQEAAGVALSGASPAGGCPPLGGTGP